MCKSPLIATVALQVTIFLMALVFAASPAHAHSGSGLNGGFVTGFLHPLVDTEQLFLLVAAALVAGRMAQGAIRSAMLALAAGLRQLQCSISHWLALVWKTLGA
ncbi:MAG: HupE/UreJ family protein [Nitratireductor sp.]